VLDIWPTAADEINTVTGVMNSDNEDSMPKVHYKDSDLQDSDLHINGKEGSSKGVPEAELQTVKHKAPIKVECIKVMCGDELVHGSKNKLEAPGMHSDENVHSDKVEREMCNNENVCSNKQDGSKDIDSDHNTYGNGPDKKHSSNGTLKASTTNDIVLSAPKPTQQDTPTLQRDAGVGGELRDLSNDDNSCTIGSGASECAGPNEGSDTPIPSGNVASWNLMLNETAPNATDDTPPVIPPQSTGVGAESTGVWDEGQNMHSKNAGVMDDGTSKGLSTNSDCHQSNQVKEWYAVGYDIVTRGETVPDTSLSISEPEAPSYSELIAWCS
jgi:hypothetical protein